MELQTHDTQKNLTHNTSHLTLFQTDYLAYGEELTEPLQTENGTILNKIGFTGHEHDYGTGFINMQARLQNPEIGKFLSVDPGYDYDQNDPMSFNLYAYVRGNPVIGVDPDGKDLKLIYKVNKEYMSKGEQNIDYEKVMHNTAQKFEQANVGKVTVVKVTGFFGRIVESVESAIKGEGSLFVEFNHNENSTRENTGGHSTIGSGEGEVNVNILEHLPLDADTETIVTNITTHELGHGAGLNHPFYIDETGETIEYNNGYVMSPSPTYSETSGYIHEFSEEEKKFLEEKFNKNNQKEENKQNVQ